MMVFVMCTVSLVFGVAAVVWNRPIAEEHARFYHFGPTGVMLLQVGYYILGPMSAVFSVVILVAVANLISSAIFLLAGLLLLGFARLLTGRASLFYARLRSGNDSGKAMATRHTEPGVAILPELGQVERAQSELVRTAAYLLGTLLTAVGLIGLIYTLAQGS
jgi:hypothetical protein